MTLDTNIVIGYLSGEEVIVTAIKQWRVANTALFLSAVVESETLAFHGFTQLERAVVERFLEENFVSVSYDRSVARLAARLRRETKIKFPDAAIAATALYTRTPLVTRNVKDFRRIDGLRLVSL